MANKELGKEIWESIKFSNYYAEDFESWYKDCFSECMEEAADAISNGVCDWNKGSFVEVSSRISKSGNPVTINVEKENFIEYYGAEQCKEMFEHD